MKHPLLNNDANRPPLQRLNLLQQWSHDPNAYATLQPNLLYFDHPHGYIALRRVLSGNIVLGDPVTETGKEAEVLSAFLEAYPRSLFAYASEQTAATLATLAIKPMRNVHLGIERWLTLDQPITWSSPILSAIKKAHKAGLVLKEQKWSELDPAHLKHLQEFNAAFVANSPSHKEMSFISRAMTFSDEPDVRAFAIFTHHSELPIGFCSLDPWYEQGQCVGYQLHQFRLAPTKLWGVYFSVVAYLVKQLQEEGYKKFSLGGSMNVEPLLSDKIPISKRYETARKAALRLANHYHPMSAVGQIKFQFEGTDIHRYLIAPHRVPLLPLLRFIKANNMPFFPKK